MAYVAENEDIDYCGSQTILLSEFAAYRSYFGSRSPELVELMFPMFQGAQNNVRFCYNN